MMSYHALFYDVVDDYLDRRAQYRDEHLRLAREAYERGELLLAGAFADPADRALLVFRTPDRRAVEEFVQKDPYVRAGLVKRWEIRPWMVAVGDTPAGG